MGESELRISSDFDLRAPEYETQSFWARDPKIASYAIDLLKGHAIGNLLDAGGGTGALARVITQSLGSSSVLIVDPSSEMLKRAPSVFETLQSDIETLNLQDRVFDTIILRQVLHYAEDPSALLRKLKTLLDENGRLYVGQIVTANDASSEWLHTIAQRLSPNRKRVWTAQALLTSILSADLSLVEARLHSFRDDIRSWSRRSVLSADEHALLSIARDALTEDLQKILNIQDTSETLYFQVFWFHALIKH